MIAERESNAETPDPDLGHGQEVAPGSANRDPLDPWAALPRFTSRQLRLERRITRWARDRALSSWLQWLEPRIGTKVEIGPPEIIGRATGLRRPGMIGQLRWPAMGSRLAIGLEIPLAHAIVDRLLGYDRPLSETRLQLTPVEWGVWTYLVVRILDKHLPRSPHAAEPGIDSSAWPLDTWDLLLDRVSPDPFDPAGLGPIATLRWPVRVGSTAGAARVWLTESLLELVPEVHPRAAMPGRASTPSPGEWSSLWHAEAASVAMPRGLGRLRTGGVLPLSGSRLAGTPQSPTGAILLACDLSDPGRRLVLPAEPVAGSGGRLVRLTGEMTSQPRTPDTRLVGINRNMNTNPSQPDEQGTAPEAFPLDVPVTLTVELGKVNLTLNRLADLRPGDVLELGRHSREPVELTSGGRLVARGELILIDTELGVRVTHVFL